MTSHPPFSEKRFTTIALLVGFEPLVYCKFDDNPGCYIVIFPWDWFYLISSIFFFFFYGSPIIKIFQFQFDAEFRRISLSRKQPPSFDDFTKLVERLHGLNPLPFVLSYTDPKDGDLLPITNEENYARALQMCRPLLRLHVQRKGIWIIFINILKVCILSKKKFLRKQVKFIVG